MDLIFRRANLPDGRTRIDVGIDGDRIVAVEPQLRETAAEEIDAEGRLLSPPFVDAHFHLDAALSLGLPRMNRSGTLLEGIALWGELKPRLTHQAVVARALAYCDMAVAQGLLAIRSHVDVCDDRLIAVEWPFADFLNSPASGNWFFGTQYVPYFVPADTDYARGVFTVVETTPMQFWTNMAIAFALAILSTRAGLAWGTWMQRLRR